MTHSEKCSNRWRDDQGTVTVEAALALSTIILVAVAIIAGLARAAAFIAAIDIAGFGARAAALGTTYTPPRGNLETTVNAELITAVAIIPAPGGSVRATAIAPVEPTK